MNEKRNTVLIVDDDKDVLDLLATCLEDLPYEIVTTDNPLEAIKILSTREISLLICDLHMDNKIDGNAILAAGRKANNDIVSILMSGKMDRDDMITALNRGGISKYLEKPLDTLEVRQLVADGINRYTKQARPKARMFSSAGETTVVLKQSLPIIHEHASANIWPGNSQFRTGETLGDRYKLGEVLGTGRTGIVYLSEDLFLHTNVAVKVLSPNLTSSYEEISVLKEEARIAMTLSHRHIVRLYNFDKAGADHFLVMEYVDGCSLRHVITQDGKLPINSVALIVQACSSALSYAHEHNVIHQDLKPENILLSVDGFIKIIDFGLACLMGKQTDSDYITGTPVYMSTEQKRGETVTPKTDIYSLGIVAYELATGKHPFPENISYMDALHMEPEPLTGVPTKIRNVLEKAMASDPKTRWETVAEFSKAFSSAAAPFTKASSRSTTRHIRKTNPKKR
ncbi:MAG: protein kinase [Lentisphaerae bacterium]|nr:protein kinase [Lentisphaerota bacterium]